MEERNLTVHRIGDYIIGRKLGIGSTAIVFLGINLINGDKVAIKIIDKKLLENKKLKTQTDREVVLMKLIRSKYVVQLHQVYENSSHLFIVLDYMEGGELFDLICERGALDVTTSIILFSQVLRCISYLHSKGICHRDIKPENILLDANHLNIKLIDFGYSCFAMDEMLTEYNGTPEYTAPEVLKRVAYNPFLADVYSCGILLHVMLYGYLPWCIQGVQIIFPDNHGSGDLLSKMLQEDPSRRISLEQAMQHPFVRNALESIIETPIAIYGGTDIASPNSDLLGIMCCLLPNIHVSRIRDLLGSPTTNTAKEMYRLLENYHSYSGNGMKFSRTGFDETLFAIPTGNSAIPFNEVGGEADIVVVCEHYDDKQQMISKINQICIDLGIKEWTFSTMNGENRVQFEVVFSTDNGYNQICLRSRSLGDMFKDVCTAFRVLLN